MADPLRNLRRAWLLANGTSRIYKSAAMDIVLSEMGLFLTKQRPKATLYRRRAQ